MGSVCAAKCEKLESKKSFIELQSSFLITKKIFLVNKAELCLKKIIILSNEELFFSDFKLKMILSD